MNRKSVSFVLVVVAALLGSVYGDLKTMKVSLQADGAEPVGVVNLRPPVAPSR